MPQGKIVIPFIASSTSKVDDPPVLLLLTNRPCVVVACNVDICLFAPQAGSFLALQFIINTGAFVVMARVDFYFYIVLKNQLELCGLVRHWNLSGINCFKISRKFRVHLVMIPVQPGNPRDTRFFQKPLCQSSLCVARYVFFRIKTD